MSAEFHFDVDPSRDLVRIRMSGFFTPEDIETFLHARAVAHAQLRCGPNQHLTINDIRDMKIQSQEVVDMFRDMLAAPEYRSRRLAFVVSPTLARTQLARTIAGRTAQCFEDFWSAESWLFARDSDSEAA